MKRLILIRHAKSSWKYNVSDIDPEDYVTEIDTSVNNDIDNLVNNYLDEDIQTTDTTKQSLPPQSASDDEHITSQQLAEMFEHLQ